MDALLAALGRRGAWPIIRTLRNGEATHLRGLATEASVPVSTTARVVSDLEALGVVETLRPGRNALIEWREGPVSNWLSTLSPPDLVAGTLEAFRTGYTGPGKLSVIGQALPVRIQIDADDDAWDHVDGGLDAVREAGWPAPFVDVTG